jgi:magnesium transporter
MLRLLNGMVDRYLELRQPLTEQLERWQRRLLDSRRNFHEWYELLEARSEMRKLEQLCEEQLDSLQGWIDERTEETRQPGAIRSLSDAQQVRASNVIEHIHRVHNHARRLQDSIETAVQLHFSMTSHRTNEIMRTLTSITAIFLPLTLITGIFGMNFDSMPGTQQANGFWVTIGAMSLIAVLLIAYFRAQRFLDRLPKSPLGRKRGV